MEDLERLINEKEIFIKNDRKLLKEEILNELKEKNQDLKSKNYNNIEELYQPKICSHSSCSMTAQPGREYCAFHCRLIIEEQKKQKQAG